MVSRRATDGVRRGDTLIKFANRKNVEQCIDNRSKLAIFYRVEPGFDPNTPIYINQHLSPFISKLAFYGRSLKRNGYINALSALKGAIKIIVIRIIWLGNY